jgi:alpha-L-fucosidase
VFKDAGMKGVILTAKHHDGFCLWPSKFSPHTVLQSKWRDGRGDVVRELSDACREFGLKFGVYLSPWDRAHPAYGDSPRYNAAYRGMLEELLSNYGPIFEMWWDGACGEGPNGKKQEYDFDDWTALVRKLQPDAVIFSDVGPDVRWVGNEEGKAGETCWGMISPAGYGRGATGPPQKMLNEGLEDGTDWIPAECDVSIRPGWFWHAEEDGKVKSLAELDAIWHASVGRGASLLLNVPANRSGRISDADAQRLVEFRRHLDAIESVDLAREARVTTDSAGVQVDLPAQHRLDRVLLQEPIAQGQRVKAFVVEAREAGLWREIARGTTVGRKRILRTDSVETDGVRIRITDARGTPRLDRVGLFGAE